LDIINPDYVAKEDSIFFIRKKEYDKLLETVQIILQPIEDIGFQVSELEFKDMKVSGGELHKSVKQQLVIKLQKDIHEIDLSMSIPKLLDNNYMIINGRRKIPLFQLFDIPIVTRGKSIKLRTNVSALVINLEKDAPYVWVNFLRKKVPLSLITLCYFGYEETEKKFGLSKIKELKQDTLFNKFIYDLKSMWEDSKDDIPFDDLIKELGTYYSTYNPRVKGEDTLFALNLIPRVDPMSFAFFKTESILDELIMTMEEGGEYDDTDYQNKRIRCWEYILLCKVSKAIFDLCISNRTAKRPKFNINSSQILSDCNVSDIVQFDFAINPIDELTKLSRTSLVGPGGFKRENVPEHLRDITPSMFGRMCPVDTPDRDNCGVLQNLIVNTKTDANGRFTDEQLTKQPISVPVSMVPFLEKDDQTRLQMASSQMRQAIMLKDFEQAMIQSGCEGLYTGFSQFVKTAKKDGEVLHQDANYIIVRYKDDVIDIFNIEYRKIYVGNLDLINVYVKQGDKFKAGDILAESNFCQDGKINIGRNLLTGIMVYYGYNYEDGIVISDRLVKDDIFTSIHYIDLSFSIPPNKVLLSLDDETYKPLPNVMESVTTGSPYSILKEMPSGPMDFSSIFDEKIELTTKKNILITDVNIYANEWNSEIPEYKKWIEEKLETQKTEQDEFQKILFEIFPKQEATQFIKDNNLDRFSHVTKYKEKGEKINGIMVNLFGIYTRPIQVGDKIGNRHGNKGVISTIVPHDQMPQLEDGRHMDICINPLGIISRMNIGQLFELHLSMSLYDLKKELYKRIESTATQKATREYLIEYIKLIDNTDGSWYSTQFEEECPRKITKEFIDELTLIQAPFSGVTAKHLEEAVMPYTKTDYEYKVFDPVSNSNLQNEIAVGYMHFFRMVHIAESRLAARGVGTYARKTLQPLAGRKNKGGQRCGEMETACLIGHDAPKNLFEFLTTKSDCIDLKNKYIKQTVESNVIPQIDNVMDQVSESVKLLDACLTVIGIDKDE